MDRVGDEGMEDELAMCGLLLGVMLEYKTSLLVPVRK